VTEALDVCGRAVRVADGEAGTVLDAYDLRAALLVDATEEVARRRSWWGRVEPVDRSMLLVFMADRRGGEVGLLLGSKDGGQPARLACTVSPLYAGG